VPIQEGSQKEEGGAPGRTRSWTPLSSAVTALGTRAVTCVVGENQGTENRKKSGLWSDRGTKRKEIDKEFARISEAAFLTRNHANKGVYLLWKPGDWSNPAVGEKPKRKQPYTERDV